MTSSAGLTNHASMLQKATKLKFDLFNYLKRAWMVCASGTLLDKVQVLPWYVSLLIKLAVLQSC